VKPTTTGASFKHALISTYIFSLCNNVARDNRYKEHRYNAFDFNMDYNPKHHNLALSMDAAYALLIVAALWGACAQDIFAYIAH
jgi:hypothetical protein